MISGMSGLAPLNCLLLCATIVLLAQSRLIVVWRSMTESTRATLTVVPWQSFIIILIAGFLVSSQLHLWQRQQFRIKHVLQQLKDEHIEQLEREKERFAIHNQFRTKYLLPCRRQKGHDKTLTKDETGHGSDSITPLAVIHDDSFGSGKRSAKRRRGCSTSSSYGVKGSALSDIISSAQKHLLPRRRQK
jgi:hypothetical protein